ncbi:hypothetical protein CF326_g1790 [Tilletia indica]|nr:hypothetical protein CF326_g1790 [Tilletia indica]
MSFYSLYPSPSPLATAYCFPASSIGMDEDTQVTDADTQASHDAAMMEDSQADYLPPPQRKGGLLASLARPMSASSSSSSRTLPANVLLVKNGNAYTPHLRLSAIEDLGQAKVEIFNLRGQQRSAASDLTKALKQVASMKASEVKIKAERKEWAVAKASLEDQTNVLAKEIASLSKDKSRLMSYMTDVVGVSERHDAVCIRNKQLEEDLRRLQDESSARLRDMEEKGLEISTGCDTSLCEARHEISGLRRALEELRGQYSTLQLQYDSRTASMLSEIDALRREREANVLERDQLQREVHALSHGFAEGQIEVSDGSFPSVIQATPSSTAPSSPSTRASSGSSPSPPDGHRMSSPPWLLESTDMERYEAARAYAKESMVKDCVPDLFADMREKMRVVLASCGSSVEPGPFMALINEGCIGTTDVTRRWWEELSRRQELEEREQELERQLKVSDSRIDRSEVALMVERGRVHDCTEQMIQLRARVRDLEGRLSSPAVGTSGGLEPSSGTPVLATPTRQLQLQVESRQYGSLVVKRVTPSPSSSVLPH